ncbi:hypothetical protein [Bremerella sp. P1]|uniref:hypothetical protein n=1 Tax=Bremerella sp. P1 TaxID=3026424 RepID=UPI00236835D7|nr:hypothetical protein [Bremerella sp. P1]WDI45093.1 hypothetical protein PSR63_14235 [Bremerella sp. P1]
MTLVVVLIVLNVPVYLFLAWVVFDTAGDAADTFWDTIVTLLKMIFIPPWLRMMMGMEESEALGVFPIAAFFIGCAAITFGEWWLLDKYVMGT